MIDASLPMIRVQLALFEELDDVGLDSAAAKVRRLADESESEADKNFFTQQTDALVEYRSRRREEKRPS